MRVISVLIKVSELNNLEKILEKLNEIKKTHPNISINVEVAC